MKTLSDQYTPIKSISLWMSFIFDHKWNHPVTSVSPDASTNMQAGQTMNSGCVCIAGPEIQVWSAFFCSGVQVHSSGKHCAE